MHDREGFAALPSPSDITPSCFFGNAIVQHTAIEDGNLNSMADVPTFLCRPGPSAFGIAHGALPDSLIVTLEDGILEYDTSTQERKAGWTLGNPRLSFVTAVEFNTKSQTYFAAVSNADKSQQVLSWQADAQAGPLDRVAARVNLPKPVHSIHPTTCNPSPSNSEAGDRSEDERPTDSATDSAASTSGQEKQHGGVFVVFTDGSVALENYYCNGRKGESIHGGGRVLAASCRRGKLAVLTARDGSSPEVAVYSLLDGNLALLGSSALSSPGGAGTVSSMSLRGQALSVLWSQGTLSSYLLHQDAQSGFSMRLQASRRLAGMEETAAQPPTPAPKNGKKLGKVTGKRKSAVLEMGTPRPRSAVVTGPNSIIATVHWQGEEIGGRKRLKLNVVDGMYGTARRAQELASPEAESGAAAKAHTLKALHMGGNSQEVAILAGGCVLLAEIQDPAPTLASLVGALNFSGRAPMQQAAKAAFHEEEWPQLRPPATIGRGRPVWMPRGDARDALPQDTLREIAVPLEPRYNGGAAHAGAAKDRDDVTNQVSAASTYATRESAAALVDLLLQSAPWGKGSRLRNLPPNLFSHLLLCLAEREYWEEVERVTGGRRVDSLALTPGLLPLLAAGGQHRLLAKMLPLVKDASLEDLLPSLEGLLSTESTAVANGPHHSWHSDLQEAASEAQAAASNQAAGNGPDGDSPAKLRQEAADAAAVVDGFSETECLLHPFVATGVDSLVLVKLLRQLGMQACLLLATYLLTWLTKFLEPGVSQKGRVLSRGGCLPSLRQVIQWSGAVIDAHLIAFASDQHAAQVALEMQKAVGAHRSAIPSLSPLLGMVAHICKRGPLPKGSSDNSMYSIQLLDLTIAR